MNVFQLRDRVIDDYAAYVRSFLRMADPAIKAFVEAELARGRLWPDPLVQLNPAFEPGSTIDELVGAGALHPECARIFRRDKGEDGGGWPLRLHRHQQDALAVAQTGASYVLTTGTGSGKSLAYFVPIVDHVLRHGSRRGIKAIVVYPMNALCNSQLEELRKYLQRGYGAGREPVTFARYTGQERAEERERVAARPPDILLTNYVMLELLMTRVDENDRRVLAAAESLEFLILDELHTYRGRQGADVAMLARRVRERLGAPTMRCVGTSATLAGAGTREERAAEVARIAARLFGAEVRPEHVIGETLRSVIARPAPTGEELAAALTRPAVYSADYTALAGDPVAAWAETAFGLRRDERGRLERRPPVTLTEGVARLAEETGVEAATCRRHLQAVLLAGYEAKHPETGLSLFAFRLHQFVSRGDTVYSSLEPADQRHLALEGQVYVPGSRERRLFPLAFCRECGQEYAVVDRHLATNALLPRELDSIAPEGGREVQSGFLFLDPDERWTGDLEALPEDWLETRPDGSVRVKPANERWRPTPYAVYPDGRLEVYGGAGATPAWFMPAPFRFCPACGVSYESFAVRGADFSRLGELATEGRSTATTVLSLAIVRALRETDGVDATARKLLSFTDNRQDASLQAGHFNDFVQVALLRGALYTAVEAAGAEGLGQDVIADRVTAALDLGFGEYASSPEARYGVERRTNEALRDVVGYRVYLDLRRGWRVNAPNLEQTGLLRVEYDDLAEVCADEPLWRDRHPLLAAATPEQRRRACQVVLDTFRRDLAIKVKYLDAAQQEAIKSNSFQFLTPPWAIEEDEQMVDAPVYRVGAASPRSRQRERTISPTSALGRFLRRPSTWPESLDRPLPRKELPALAEDLLGALLVGGQIEDVGGGPAGPGRAALYQLQAGAIRWLAGAGDPPPPDPLRVARPTAADARTNEFFRDLYARVALGLRGMEAHEHTAQVPAAERVARERAFREGELPVLYCSPTMELGIDIRDLNAVNMRNVPPTPANYAQRSGRAGRSGQPALVLTYCSSLSPHDQYFFRRQARMVSGQVMPPRIELANEDLIRSHLHAVWLAETGAWLGHSLRDVLDLGRPDDGLPLQAPLEQALRDGHARARALERGERLATALAGDLREAAWYDAEWVARTVDEAPAAFDRACDRWRQLYLSAREQREAQHAIAGDHSASAEARRTAERLRAEAETQLRLLTDGDSDLGSDFYSYRYFASEGFLPGYNFPRLPLAAYLPGRFRRGGGGPSGRDEFVSRARFLAISEFGPRSIIYYEGNRYRVEKVILPLHRREEGEAEASRTTIGKVCPACGYGHLGAHATDERCRHCGERLDGRARYFPNLFRLANVTTRRIDRITSDEEERQRQGFELMTAFHFAETKDGPAVARAEYRVEGEAVAGASYAPTATLWRLNLGWNRRKEKGIHGFLLDMEKGTWAKQELERVARDSDGGAASEADQARVVPFVEDRRNALLLRLAGPLEANELTSLLYALKRGIEARYQLEDSEVAGELLPSGGPPTAMLFYEAAEGGAGALSRLVAEPHELAWVAKAALEVCHFDPTTGEDRGRAEGAAEDCEAACYNCLLGYTNQREHPSLDRKLIVDLLLRLTDAVGGPAPAAGPLFVSGSTNGDEGQAAPVIASASRSTRRDALLAGLEDDLECAFVRFLDAGGYRLPDAARPTVGDARPDFAYAGTMTCVYVDGDDPARRGRDAGLIGELEDSGYTVVRLGGEADWPAELAGRAWLFGEGEGR